MSADDRDEPRHVPATQVVSVREAFVRLAGNETPVRHGGPAIVAPDMWPGPRSASGPSAPKQWWNGRRTRGHAAVHGEDVQAFRQLVLRAKLPGLVVAFFVVLSLHAPCASGQPIQQRDVQHDVSVLFNRAMKVATGGGGHVALGDKVDFDVPPRMVFVPREAADALLTVAGRKPPQNYVGLVLNDAAVGWFVIIRVVNDGHVDADAMTSWTPDDVIASARDERASENRELDRQGLPPLEVRRWITRPDYNPLLHRLIWCPLVLQPDARRDAGGEVVNYGAQFGRRGYVRLAMTTVLDTLPQEAAILGVIMDHIAYAPGASYADFIPNRDPVDPAGLAGVFGYEHLRKADLTTRLRSFGDPLIVPAEILAAIAMAGAILFVVYRWWRLQRPMR